VIGDAVALALSLRRNGGDIEVLIGAGEADALVEALRKARAMLEEPS
jgi:hypothetical protein